MSRSLTQLRSIYWDKETSLRHRIAAAIACLEYEGLASEAFEFLQQVGADSAVFAPLRIKALEAAAEYEQRKRAKPAPLRNRPSGYGIGDAMDAIKAERSSAGDRWDRAEAKHRAEAAQRRLRLVENAAE